MQSQPLLSFEQARALRFAAADPCLQAANRDDPRSGPSAFIAICALLLTFT